MTAVQSETGPTQDVPIPVRLAFAHAALQVIATDAHIDLLHIKGVAADSSIRAMSVSGSDADVLVRPSQVSRLLDQLGRHGWQHYSDFESGSPFAHAATLHHRSWGFADIHRLFPGIGLAADDAFEELWSTRMVKDLAGVACHVPALTAQVLIVVLNAARSGGSAERMAAVRTVWEAASPERRHEVTALVTRLTAEVAFAAGLGNLEQYRGRRDYHLWKVTSQGGTRLEEWVARVRAAPTPGAAFRLAARAPLVNVEHLALRIGHQPTRLELLGEFVGRPYRGVAEELGRLCERPRRRHTRSP